MALPPEMTVEADPRSGLSLTATSLLTNLVEDSGAGEASASTAPLPLPTAAASKEVERMVITWESRYKDIV